MIPLRGCHSDQPFIREGQQCLADRCTADAEFAGDLVQIESGAWLHSAGEDPIAQLSGGSVTHGPTDQLDI